MAEVTIEARPNGPYVVTGTIELRDTDGNVLPTQSRVVLCRCGASTKKPFCDGTHSKIGFQAAAQAVPASTEDASALGVRTISAGDIAVPAAALDAAESEGVISGVDPADVEKAETEGAQGKNVPLLLEDLYHNPNGDRWQLMRDPASGRMFVRHEANPASGGRISDTVVEEFLSHSGSGPEYAALRRRLSELGESRWIPSDRRS
jgi:3-phenylpropionate/trans-cinnamate dioxygenase ferredoxin subunit